MDAPSSRASVTTAGLTSGQSPAQTNFPNVGSQVTNLSGSENGTRGDLQQVNGEDEPKLVEEIESLCMNCHEDGTTKLLLTRIPFFREIVIMSFDCPHCGFHNAEIQSAGQIQQRGSKYLLKVDKAQDLQRQVVKSDTCAVRIEDIDLEIPAGRGQLTNVEGILSNVVEDLSDKQDERQKAVPEVYLKIEAVLSTLRQMLEGTKLPFTMTLDDPAGNSWIEPASDDKSAKYSKQEYPRTSEQNEALGLSAGNEAYADDGSQAPGPMLRPEYHATQMVPAMPGQQAPAEDDDIVEGQVYSFPASCPGCMRPCDTNMKMVNIPFFKQVVLMSTSCQHCGYRSNEVKTGGEVPDRGRRITLEVTDSKDLSRDILKSESCAMEVPELNLSVEPGTLGGRFTTIEGLLTQVRDDLHASIFSDEGASDSMRAEDRTKWGSFFDTLSEGIDGKRKFTVILSDPLASSYIQSFNAPDPDPQMTIADYERTEEEEESLGLKDMKTEGYEETEKA